MAQLLTEQQCLARQCDVATKALVADAKSLLILAGLLPGTHQAAARDALANHVNAVHELQFVTKRLAGLADEQAALLERIYAISLHAVDLMRFMAANMQVPANDDFGCLEELAQIQELIEPVFPGEPTLGA